MNPKIIKLAGVFMRVLPNLKSFIFADGKFQAVRALYLMMFMVIIGGMVYFLGFEETAQIVDLLDDVSDLIGYVE